MKDNLKIGLLGIIALTLIVDTFFMKKNVTQNQTTPVSNIVSNIAATPPAGEFNATYAPTTIPPTPIQPISPSETRAKTSIKFAEMSHSFGEVLQDTKNTFVFKFTNTGSEPLIIENATGSCGCTIPTFPKEPIAPGKTGNIEVVYSPGKQQGEQAKTVTITANTNPIQTILNISAKVKVP